MYDAESFLGNGMICKNRYLNEIPSLVINGYASQNTLHIITLTNHIHIENIHNSYTQNKCNNKQQQIVS